MYSQPYSYDERQNLLDNVRTMPIRVHLPRNDSVKPLVDKLCLLIAKHDYLPSDTDGYTIEVE